MAGHHLPPDIRPLLQPTGGPYFRAQRPAFFNPRNGLSCLPLSCAPIQRALFREISLPGAQRDAGRLHLAAWSWSFAGSPAVQKNRRDVINLDRPEWMPDGPALRVHYLGDDDPRLFVASSPQHP
jgi:hypothetical protein